MLSDNDVVACLAVKDMAKAKEFYEGKLGLAVGMETSGGTYYKAGKTGVFVYPSQYAGSNKATAAAWNIEDVEGAVAELKGKGIEFEHYPDMPDVQLKADVHVMGDLKAAWFKDPDGNILNIVNQVG